MRALGRAAGLLSGLALAACSSSPSHFYTLLPPPSAPAAANANYRIEVQPVELPDQVATEQMVVRISNGELVPVETRRWIAPLGEEIRGALSASLSRRLGAADVSGLPAAPAGAASAQQPPVYLVNVKVQRFESALGTYARIDALWNVHRSGEPPGPVCTSSVSQPVGPGYDALAEGHQRALAALADQIARSIAAAAQSHAAPACPAG